jgi:ABC-type molybdate transport system substrate-binding protein
MSRGEQNSMSTPKPTLATAWVGLVLSNVGQAVLRKAGFLTPEGKAP